MKYFDTFTGIGGFTLGIEQAYENYICSRNGQSQKEHGETKAPQQSIQTANEDTQRSRYTASSIFPRSTGQVLGRPECIGYSEIDKYASQIYENHYPNHKNYGDITKIDTDELPDFDLLVGGFPCQAFSVAGKRLGFDDTRGTLFFELARILKDKRPRYFIFENVKGLLSHQNGQTFETILEVLTDIGYECQWQLLNSKDFGVPQNRERVYIVGHLRGECSPKVFPLTGANTATLKEYTRGQSQGNRIYATDGVSTTLASQAGGLGAKTGLYFIDLSTDQVKLTHNARTLQARYNKGYSKRAAETSGVIIAQRGRYNEDGVIEQQAEPRKDDLTNTLTSVQKDNLLLQQPSIRRLTPTECERLQAFPDGWTEGLSDTQRYKCLGNAVTVNVVKAVVDKLL